MRSEELNNELCPKLRILTYVDAILVFFFFRFYASFIIAFALDGMEPMDDKSETEIERKELNRSTEGI